MVQSKSFDGITEENPRIYEDGKTARYIRILRIAKE
jgi:hypothetical protein